MVGWLVLLNIHQCKNFDKYHNRETRAGRAIKVMREINGQSTSVVESPALQLLHSDLPSDWVLSASWDYWAPWVWWFWWALLASWVCWFWWIWWALVYQPILQDLNPGVCLLDSKRLPLLLLLICILLDLENIHNASLDSTGLSFSEDKIRRKNGRKLVFYLKNLNPSFSSWG